MFEFHPIARTAVDFQQSISAGAVEAICRHAFGSQTQAVAARELGAGMFNSTYLLQLHDGQQVVLRVSPQPQAAVFTHERHLLRREQGLETTLTAVCPLAPRTLYADFSQELLDRDWVIQTFMAGELWDEVQGELSEADTAVLWQQLAEIAKQIHTAPGPHFGFPDNNPGFERWGTAVAHITKIMRDDLATIGLDRRDTQTYADCLAAGQALLDAVTIPRLVHGDLWPKNVLIDRSQPLPQIVSLLDAERGIWGDPLAEWIFYYYEVPNAFWNVYGRPPTDPATQFRQLAYHGLYTIQLLLEATRFGWEPEPFWQTLAQVNQKMERMVS
jgi:aminoglycoside phosphotransferase (APT) family kinase protein